MKVNFRVSFLCPHCKVEEGGCDRLLVVKAKVKVDLEVSKVIPCGK